jgi:hypothetical protein
VKTAIDVEPGAIRFAGFKTITVVMRDDDVCDFADWPSIVRQISAMNVLLGIFV